MLTDRRLIVRRPHPANPAGTPADLAAAAGLVAGVAGTRPLTFSGAGQPITNIESYLTRVRAARAAGRDEVFNLADQLGPTSTLLFYDWDLDPERGGERLWVPLPNSAGWTEDGDAVARLLVGLVHAFGAFTGYVEDPRLSWLTRGRRALQRADENRPPGLGITTERPNLDPQPLVTQLLVPDEFDLRHAPDGIWWLAYWDYELGQSIGPGRVQTAEWASRFDFDSGAVLVQATNHLLDSGSASDLALVDRLIVQLDLPALQHRWRW